MAAMNATTAEPSAICAGVGGQGGTERKRGPWPALARLITFHSSFIHNENRSYNNNLNEQSNNRADFVVFFLFCCFCICCCCLCCCCFWYGLSSVWLVAQVALQVDLLTLHARLRRIDSDKRK